MFTLEFIWPQTGGEWLAWLVALLMLAISLWILLAPRKWLFRMGPKFALNCPEALPHMRGPMAGTNVGLSLVTLSLHPQPLLYAALGCALFFSASGRLISVFIDKSSTKYNWLALIFEGMMAFPPLAYAFGLID